MQTKHFLNIEHINQDEVKALLMVHHDELREGINNFSFSQIHFSENDYLSFNIEYNFKKKELKNIEFNDLHLEKRNLSIYNSLYFILIDHYNHKKLKNYIENFANNELIAAMI